MLREIRAYLRPDCARLDNVFSPWTFIRMYLLSSAFALVVWFRLTRYWCFISPNKVLFLFSYLMLRRLQRKTGVYLSHRVKIGKGFKLVHTGITYINSGTVIGENCTMMHNVTIGVKSGEDTRVAEIGDNVFIGPNVVILGGVKIGNNVTIGANCVVTKDFPNNALVVGVPGINKYVATES